MPNPHFSNHVGLEPATIFDYVAWSAICNLIKKENIDLTNT